MTQIVIDKSMKQRLLVRSEPVELVDETGVVLGAFCPRQQPYDPRLIPPIDSVAVVIEES